MKKIISLGIASAVLALTAVAASAELVAATSDAVVTGETIAVTITTTTENSGAVGFTVAAEGLAFVEADYLDGALGSSVTKEDGSIEFGIITTNAIAADTVVATITYTVTAEAGEDVAVVLSAGGGVTDTYVNFTQVAEAPEASDPDTSDPDTSDDDSSDVDSSDADASDDTGDAADPEQPDTGVALAIVPAVLAGAAVVVAKKRK